MLPAFGENSKTVPSNLISWKENMYENITLMLKFLFKYCEEQEHELQETSLVLISLLKSENQAGHIQIDVDGSWLKKFNIRRFITAANKNEKLNFEVFYGNIEKTAFYYYNVKYNYDIERTETKLTLQPSAVINKDYYLRVTINSTESILTSILYKLRNFLSDTGPKYPNVTIQFDEATYKTNRNPDSVCIEMIAEGFKDVLQYSTNSDFRRKIFEKLNVSSKEWAAKEIQNKLENLIKKN